MIPTEAQVMVACLYNTFLFFFVILLFSFLCFCFDAKAVSEIELLGIELQSKSESK